MVPVDGGLRQVLAQDVEYNGRTAEYRLAEFSSLFKLFLELVLLLYTLL